MLSTLGIYALLFGMCYLVWICMNFVFGLAWGVAEFKWWPW